MNEPPTHPQTFADLSRHVANASVRDRGVLCVSAMNFDYLYAVDEIKPDYETFLHRVVSAPGGSGANTAAGLARLDARTAVAGIVGSDQKGMDLIKALTDVGVDCTQVLTAAGQDNTGEAVIFAKGDRGGGRMIVVSPQVNSRYKRNLETQLAYERLLGLARNSSIVHFSSFVGSEERELQEELMKELKDQVIISLNPGALYSKLGLQKVAGLLGRADIMFVYEDMLDLLLGTESTPTDPSVDLLQIKVANLGARLSERGFDLPAAILVKRAWSSGMARYVALCDQDASSPHSCSASAGAGQAIVDPTGAGDAMAAGVLFSLLRGANTIDAVDLAYVMAMSASSKMGGRAGLPSKMELGRLWSHYLGGVRPFPSWLHEH